MVQRTPIARFWIDNEIKQASRDSPLARSILSG